MSQTEIRFGGSLPLTAIGFTLTAFTSALTALTSALTALTSALMALTFSLLALTSPAAYAQSSGDQMGIIEEVVVTARRREERLQDVPGSVTALSGDELAQAGVSELGDIQASLPNLVLHEGDAQNAVAYIRGIGQVDSLSFADPGVGIYVDDVYLGRTQGAFLDVFDVERIEVLRGPQGTYYGRNTIGGAIKFVSATPSDEPELRGTLTLGDYSRQDLKLSYSGPLGGGNNHAKFALASLNRDGYATNNADNKDDGDKKTLAWRAAALLNPSDSFSLDISLDGTRDNPDTSRTPARATVVNIAWDADATAPADAFPVNSDPFRIDADFNNLNDLETNGISAKATWDISSDMVLTSITAWRDLTYETYLDLDGTSASTFGVFVDQKQDQITQELQLALNTGYGNWIIGLYYFREDDLNENGIYAPDYSLAGAAFGYATNSLNDQETTSIAVYADASFDISEKMSASLGLRYTKEDKKLRRLYRENFLANLSIKLPINDTTASYNRNVSDDYDDLSPRATLSYHFSDRMTGYASISRGYKAGGFDGRADSRTSTALRAYKPEKLLAYEFGLKASSEDQRLTANLALFFNDYEDLQVSSFSKNAQGGFAAEFSNAGEASIAGLELEAAWQTSEMGRLQLALGWLDAEYDEFIQGNVDLADTLTPVNAPELTAYLGYEHRWSVADNMELLFMASANYRDDVYPTVSSSEVLKQDAYTLYNASIALDINDGQTIIRLGGNNVSDEEYINHAFDLSANPGYQLAYYGAPSNWDLSVTVTW